MPSGKTHDLVTFMLAPPTFAAAWGLSGSLAASVAATAGVLFGGLMFGPDLDIQSRQYTRWGVFRFLWLPYKVAFKHRSRWSHGIVFGTLIRIVYFAAVLTLVFWAGIYARSVFLMGDATPGWSDVVRAWQVVESEAASHGVGWRVLIAALAGLWWGAASHTLTDVAWSVIRKGSEIF